MSSVYPGNVNFETISVGFLSGVSGLPQLAGKTTEKEYLGYHGNASMNTE